MGKGNTVGSPQMPAGPLTESALVPGSGWRFVPGHPQGIPQGFVLGSAWPAKNWEEWGNPCQPSSPELLDPSCSAPCMAPHPAALWCHPRMGCRGAVQGAVAPGSRICPWMFTDNLQM